MCPECGRPFDPADPTTYDTANVRGVARAALGRMSRRWVAACAAAAGLAWCTVPWPVRGWRWSLGDVGYYREVMSAPGTGWKVWGNLTGVERVYVAGVALGVLLAVWGLVRAMARGWVVWRRRPGREARAPIWGRWAVGMAMLASIVGAVGMGWPYRLGQRFVSAGQGPAGNGRQPASPRLLFGWVQVRQRYGVDADLAVIRSAVLQGGGTSSEQRLAALAEFEIGTAEYYELLHEIVARTGLDGQTRATAARLLGLYAQGGSGGYLLNGAPIGSAGAPGTDELPRAVAALRRVASEDADPAARAGALDGLSVAYESAWLGGYHDPSLVQNEIDARAALRVPQYPRPGRRFGPADSPAELRAFMVDRMTGAGTGEEREAAARAVVTWPQAGKLRYAEWGVFLVDKDGRVEFAKRQLDEVPPFVHRIGNPAGELAGRVSAGRQNVYVFKPVIHLTSDRPMAVDIEVYVGSGRPWVAYPRVDDLVMSREPAVAWVPRVRARATGAEEDDDAGTGLRLRGEPARPPGPPMIDALDLGGATGLADLREGYPWMLPKHRAYEWLDAWRTAQSGPGNVWLSSIGSIGVRWQSVIVSPQKLGWMGLAAVPATADKRYDWWERLRQVESSWVSSRGEAERFLYYDGPRLWPIPPRASDPMPTVPGWVMGKPTERRVVEVEVGANGPVGFGPAEFEAELVARGLTKSEAAGMGACWRGAFFEARGKRRLTFLSERDYAVVCPLRVSPVPAKVVRVGVMWEEL